MALAGNIKEFGLADIFQIVSLQQKTGELNVEGKDGTVTILLESGFIVGANATFRPIEERLQRTLEHSQAISKFQLKRALETQKKTLQPLWTALAETKAIDLDVLKNMLSQQIHETIYHVLRWTDGEYRFEPKKSVEYDRQLIRPINSEFLVMEGFRITDEWTEVEKVITSFQILVRRVPETPDSPENLSNAESKIYQLLATKRTVQDLIDMGQLGEFDTCQTVYDLIKKHLVERVPSKIKKGKAPQVRRPSVGVMDIFVKVVTIVIVIALLVGVVIGLRYLPENLSLIHRPKFSGIDKIKRFVAQSQLDNLSGIVPLYFLNRHTWPQSLEELRAEDLISSDHLLKDPWGSPYSIIESGEHTMTLRSTGGKNETNGELSVTIAF